MMDHCCCGGHPSDLPWSTTSKGNLRHQLGTILLGDLQSKISPPFGDFASESDFSSACPSSGPQRILSAHRRQVCDSSLNPTVLFQYDFFYSCLKYKMTSSISLIHMDLFRRVFTAVCACFVYTDLVVRRPTLVLYCFYQLAEDL